MHEFMLRSEYQPTGDQPTAIAELVSRLEQGEHEQTLLGVTGSGKSVSGDSRVFIRHGESSLHVDIASVVDRLFLQYSDAIQTKDTSEYINLSDIPENEQFETVSFSPTTGTASWSSVYQVSRHTASDTMTAITTCGRSITATTDHSLYCARDGGLMLIAGNELRESDIVPVPRELPATSKDGMDLLHIGEVLRPNAGEYYVAGLGTSEAALEVLRKSGISKQKLWRIVHEGERVKLEELQNCELVDWTGLRIGSYHQKYDMPAELSVTDALLRLVGYYIAEGCYTEKYITISTGDREVVDGLEVASRELGLVLHARTGTYEYQLSSVLLAELLHSWCGRYSRGKHLPIWWPQLSKRQLGVLLGAYFDGDGSVEKNAVTASTTSLRLASDLQYALQTLNIPARCRIKNITYKGKIHRNYLVSVSGTEARIYFRERVSLLVARKRERLQKIVCGVSNTNVDIIPFDSGAFRRFRILLGMTQLEMSVAGSVSRTHISLIESGKRKPSYAFLKRLCASLRSRQFTDDETTEAIKKLEALLQLRWSPIEKITYCHDKKTVYDFAVQDDETFLAGDGGIFVHNTFTMANIIANRGVPTLVLAHNKTLAAQLFSEFKAYFPESEVHYFVSYFDYYQPEAYVASSDTYIEKDSAINEEIDRLRHAATAALLTRRDVIIVASVSCIYGIGSVEDYNAMALRVKKGERRVRDKLIRQLTDIQYHRNDIDFSRGTFRVRGDVVDVFPAGSEDAVRIEFFGDEIENITHINSLTGEVISRPEEVTIFPSSHYVTPEEKLKYAIGKIRTELDERLEYFQRNNKLLEAQRLSQRTKFDLEMLEETGFVKGIENYSRYLTNREPGEQPATLMDYFPDDFLMFIDESHMTLPQVRGMYNGDRARKEVLVEHGFRLPSALDNRPLRFDEFVKHINQVIYVSATPGDYEREHSPKPTEQIIRPTGLVDPEIEIRPIEGQIDDLIAEIRERIAKRQRVLVTTLTKRMAEDLSTYLQELDIKTAYIHSDVDTLDRSDILRDLRAGIYDVLVGINLLREGLDLPEVSLVAIMDADKEGFLRSDRALVQTIGRAARHLEGRVLMYADRITDSMQRAIDETNRRRAVQTAYNVEHGITPTSIAKALDEGLRSVIPQKDDKKPLLDLKKIPKDEYPSLIRELSAQMELHSANLEFEKAAELRDIIKSIKEKSV